MDPQTQTPIATYVVESGPGGGGSSAVWLAVVVVLVLVVVCVAMMARRKASLANALANNGWALYVMPGCGHCSRQLNILGVDVYPDQYDCKGGKIVSSTGDIHTPPLKCHEVTAFPTWVNVHSGARVVGVQDKKALVRMSTHKKMPPPPSPSSGTIVS